MYIFKSQMLIPLLAVTFFPACINFGNVLTSYATSWLKLLPKLRTSNCCSNVFSTNCFLPFFYMLANEDPFWKVCVAKFVYQQVSFSSLCTQCFLLIIVVTPKVPNCSILFSHSSKSLIPWARISKIWTLGFSHARLDFSPFVDSTDWEIASPDLWA